MVPFITTHLAKDPSFTASPSGAPGPVSQLIPPRPPSPITSKYVRKLSAHMLIPSTQIRLLDCIGQGTFSYMYVSCTMMFCRNVKLHSSSHNLLNAKRKAVRASNHAVRNSNQVLHVANTYNTSGIHAHHRFCSRTCTVQGSGNYNVSHESQRAKEPSRASRLSS